MSVTRINEFKAKIDQGRALRDHLQSFVSIIKASAGCQSCQVLQSEEDPTRIVVLEVWDNKAAHQAAAKQIPPEAIEQAMSLLDGPPKGEYFSS